MNIKIGDWVECYKKPTCLLTVGKKYQVTAIEQQHNEIYVVNDSGRNTSYEYYDGYHEWDKFQPVKTVPVSIKTLVLYLVDAQMDNDMSDVEHYCLAILEKLKEQQKPHTLNDVKVGDTIYAHKETCILKKGAYIVKSLEESGYGKYIYIDTNTLHGVSSYPLKDEWFHV